MRDPCFSCVGAAHHFAYAHPGYGAVLSPSPAFGSVEFGSLAASGTIGGRLDRAWTVVRSSFEDAIQRQQGRVQRALQSGKARQQERLQALQLALQRIAASYAAADRRLPSSPADLYNMGILELQAIGGFPFRVDELQKALRKDTPVELTALVRTQTERTTEQLSYTAEDELKALREDVTRQLGESREEIFSLARVALVAIPATLVATAFIRGSARVRSARAGV